MKRTLPDCTVLANRTAMHVAKHFRLVLLDPARSNIAIGLTDSLTPDLFFRPWEKQ